MIDQAEVLSVLQRYRGDAVVVPVERAELAWPQFSTRRQRDISPTVMGMESSFALGLCLSQPDTKVILLDGDGHPRQQRLERLGAADDQWELRRGAIDRREVVPPSGLPAGPPLLDD